MLLIHFFAISGVLLMLLCYAGFRSSKAALPRQAIAVLFVTAVLVRLAAAALSKGFGSDTACFAAWADRIFSLGPGGFYSPDVFTDYPPGYMYVLWLLGAVRSLFSIEYYSAAHLILLKLPSIACDLAAGWILWKEGSRRCSSSLQAFLLCLAYLLNPVIILNSSVWGQVDAVFTLTVAVMCLCLISGKLFPAYLAFGIGILIKPQTLMFAPVLLAGILDWVFLTDFSAKKFFKNLLQGLSVIAGMVVLCLPFGFSNVWNQYFSTVGSYPYAAVNACNLWGLFGLNWVSQENTFLGIPYRLLGGLAIAASVAAVLLLSLRNKKDREKYPFLAALLILTIYVFSVRMHERYLYPGLLLLLLAYLLKPSRNIFFCYMGFSALHFYNTADVLFFYDPANYDRKSPLILLVSAGMLLCCGYLCFTARKLYWSADAPAVQWAGVRKGNTPKRSQNPSRGNSSETFLGKFLWSPLPPRPSRSRLSLKKADWLLLVLITLVYSCFALYDLGDGQAPETHYDMGSQQTIELDFGGSIPTTLSYYIAPWQGRRFTLEGRRRVTDEWADLGQITLENVFTWQDIRLEAGVPFLRLTLQDNQASILELTFLDASGNVLIPANASQYPQLFDESELHPEVSTFRNSMYFDEIYHGRTAYEFLNGLTTYENTHPPMGKIFIALGVLIFGMNPFGWRIMGTLFGIAMVPLVYLWGKKISDSTAAAALSCALFAFDFMHFTQTRLATIDVYITFFVILMYFMMYQYSTMSFYDTPLKKTWLPLGACGVAMGFGIACKWTGVYAGAGLAVIFFAVLLRRYREYLYARKTPKGSTSGISHRSILESFSPNAMRTIGFCLIFFVAVPAAIYLLSYIPFVDYTPGRGLLSRMLNNQNTMFSYHSALNATHPYSSSWYEWPIIKRPIWYYSRIVSGVAGQGGLREGISAFGNPAVWWPGIPAALYMLWLWFKKKDYTAAFLFTGYLAQYLPWFFVTRITFIYHYFPCVVFLVMMITYSLLQLKKSLPPTVFPAVCLAYGAIVFLLFLLYYPVLSGQPVEAAFVDKYLRLFDSWVLTAR